MRRVSMRQVSLWVVGVSMVVLVFAASVSAEDAKTAAGDKPNAGKKPYRVYFIGHSLYYVNNVPSAVQFLSEAASVDRPIQAIPYCIGGGTHQTYWNTPALMKRLREEEWDIVIIAGNANDMAHPDKVNLEYAKKLDAEARKKTSRVLEYVAWPWVQVTGDQVFEKRMKAQDAYNQPFLQLAKETGVALVPCGPALVNAIKKDRRFMDDFHYGDVHVAAPGSYLTACVIFAAIYNKSPEGLPSVFHEYKIDKERARILQVTAWETVQQWQKIQAAAVGVTGNPPAVGPMPAPSSKAQ